MKWVHMRATELRIELQKIVFDFQKEAHSPEADFWLKIQVMNRSAIDTETVFRLLQKVLFRVQKKKRGFGGRTPPLLGKSMREENLAVP